MSKNFSLRTSFRNGIYDWKIISVNQMEISWSQKETFWQLQLDCYTIYFRE